MSKVEPSAHLLSIIKSHLTGINRRQRRFLLAYAHCGGVRAAADQSGIFWTNHYNWLNNENYQLAFNKARDLFADYAEQDVFQRAFIGNEKRIVRHNGDVEVVQQKSDILAMFALKGLRPQYRDNYSVNVNVAGPAQINISLPDVPQRDTSGVTTGVTPKLEPYDPEE